MTFRRPSLADINKVLAVLVILSGVYIAAYPLLPELSWRVKRARDTTAGVPYNGVLAQNAPTAPRGTIPQDNRLVIPSLSLNEPIKQGANIWVIHDGGTWLRPNTSLPSQAGNTVIVGHRLYGSTASSFYHLDKVRAGDDIAVYWEGKEILYEVAEIRTVPATAVEIEAPSEEPRLTLYTCTPIWTAKDRLVVIAYPKEKL